MKVIFLGVGEAFDENNPNNSHLILSDTKLLLDCGYSVPPQVWKYNPDPSFLDAIYISHRHADHYFGIPPLLVRMGEDNRKKPLLIICQKELKKLILELMEYGYLGTSKKAEFNVNFLEVEENKIYNLNELELSFAKTNHPKSNYAIRINDKKNTVCYSGDGFLEEENEKLYKNSDLLIQETYMYSDEIEKEHGTMKDSIEMAKRNSIKCLAFTHINRNIRKNNLEDIKKKISKENLKIIIPKPMDEYSF